MTRDRQLIVKRGSYVDLTLGCEDGVRTVMSRLARRDRNLLYGGGYDGRDRYESTTTEYNSDINQV